MSPLHMAAFAARFSFPLLILLSTLHVANPAAISVIYSEILSLPKAAIHLQLLWNGLPLNQSFHLSVCDNRHPPTFAPTSLFCGPFDPYEHNSEGFVDCAAENGFTSETINKETCIALGCCFDPTFVPTCRNKLERLPESTNDGRRMLGSTSNSTDILPRCDGLQVNADEDDMSFQAEMSGSSLLVKEIAREGTLPLLFRVSSAGNASMVVQEKAYALVVCPFGYQFVEETQSCEARCDTGSASSLGCFCGGRSFLDGCDVVDSCPMNTTYNGTTCVETASICTEEGTGVGSGQAEDCFPNRNLCKLHKGFRFNGTLCMPETFTCDEDYLFDPTACELYHYTPAPTSDAKSTPTSSPTVQLECDGTESDCYCGQNGFDALCPTCLADMSHCPSGSLEAGSRYGSSSFEAIGQVCVSTDPACRGFRSIALGFGSGQTGSEATQLYPLNAVNTSCNGTFSGFLRTNLTQDENHCAQVEAQVVIIVDFSSNIEAATSNTSRTELLTSIDSFLARLDSSLTNLTVIAIQNAEAQVVHTSTSTQLNATTIQHDLMSLSCCQGPCVLADALDLAQNAVESSTFSPSWVVLFMAGKPSPPEGAQESTYNLQTVGEAFQELKSSQTEILALAPLNVHDYYLGWPFGQRSCSILGFSQVCHKFTSPPFPLVPFGNIFKLNETEKLRTGMCRTAQETCIGLCAAGWKWDGVKQRCMPIEHTCFEGHQVNLKSCEVETCPMVLDLDVVVYLNPQRTVLRVELSSSMTLTQVNITTTSSNLVPDEDTARNAKIVEFVPVSPLLHIPHGEYRFHVSASSTCGLQQGIFPSYTVANRAPIISAYASATNGRVARFEPDESGSFTHVEVRTADKDTARVYIHVNVTEPDGEDWVLDWTTNGLSRDAHVEVQASNSQIMVVPLALGSWNSSVRVTDELGLASSMKFVVDVIGYRPPEVSFEGSMVDLSLGELSVGMLDASMSSDDGRIISFNWSVMSSNLEVRPVVESPRNATTRLLGLVNGHSVVVRLEVTDDDGLDSNATLLVTVLKKVSKNLRIEIQDVDNPVKQVDGRVVMPHLYLMEDTVFRVTIVSVTDGKSITEAWFGRPTFSISLPQASSAKDVMIVAEVFSHGKPTGIAGKSNSWTLDAGVNFRVGAWEDCSVSCGSGTQSRSLTCVDRAGNSLQVAGCDAVLGLFNRPESRRYCFSTSVECDGAAYMFDETSCGCGETSCGCGETCRDVRCISMTLGEASEACMEPAPASQSSWKRPCSLEQESTEVVFAGEETNVENVCECKLGSDGDAAALGEEVCIHSASKVVLNSEQCGGVLTANSTRTSCNCVVRSWAILSRWSNCVDSSTSREVRCVEVDENTAALTFLPDISCTHLAPKPDSQRTCQKHTQLGSAWVVSRWSPCDRSSCLMHRSVACVNLTSGSTANSCENPPRPSDTSRCDAWEACFNETGQSPNRLLLFGRGLEETQGCIAIQQDGTCCSGENAVLDKNGKCCNSGELNACGECQAAGIPDIKGDCCVSNKLDAQGVCCLSGVVDICGVCDGNGLSCGIEIEVEMDTPNVEDLYEAEIRILEVVPNSTAVDLFLKASSTALQLHLRDGLAWSDASSLLAVIETINRSEILPVRFTQPFKAMRIGTCGNGVCEIGEAAWEWSDATAFCFEDCPWQRTLSCPTVNGSVCNGHGICLYLSGECSCFEEQGYVGTACSQCNHGFEWTDDRCVAVPSFVPISPTQRPSTSTLAPSNSKPKSVLGYIGIGAGILLVLLFALAGCMIVRYRRPHVANHLDKSPMVVPERSNDEATADGDDDNIGGYPPGIRKEGWLRRWTKGDGWGKKEYYVLDNKLRALRFFSGVVESTPFNVYTGELGSIALKHLVFVRSDDKHLRVFHLAVAIEEEEPILVKLLARSKAEKKEWVEEISFFVADDAMKAPEAKTQSDNDSRSDNDSEPELVEAVAWEGGTKRRGVGSFEIAIV